MCSPPFHVGLHDEGTCFVIQATGCAPARTESYQDPVVSTLILVNSALFTAGPCRHFLVLYTHCMLLEYLCVLRAEGWVAVER